MDNKDLNCYVVSGHNPYILSAIGKSIGKMKGSAKVVFDYKISWEKDSHTLEFLDKLKEVIIKERGFDYYLVGPAFSNHIDYLETSLGFSIKKILIHSQASDFCSTFRDIFENKNPFLIDRGSRDYFKSYFANFPNYNFDPSYSLNDYIELYFNDIEDNLTKYRGSHFPEEDFLSERKVNSDVVKSFDIDVGDLYKRLNYELEEEFDIIKESEVFSRNIDFKPFKNKPKVLINTFVTPSEFRFFESQVYKMVESLLYLDQNVGERSLDLTWRVHLDLSDFHVNWEDSELSSDYLYSSFYELKGKVGKYMNVEFSSFDENIHGCNDIRRDSIRKYSEFYDTFIWLDPDVLFPKKILLEMNNIYPSIDREYSYYAISPEFLHSESSYLEPFVCESDSFDSNIEGVITHDLELVNNREVYLEQVDNLPVCGSFTSISTSFLSVVDIPDELGSYGNDDRYVSRCFQIFNNYTDDSEHVLLYKMKNMIVTQIKESVKEDSSFSFYLEENNDKSKEDMHEETQNYLDTLFDDFKDELKSSFQDE